MNVHKTRVESVPVVTRKTLKQNQDRVLISSIYFIAAKSYTNLAEDFAYLLKFRQISPTANRKVGMSQPSDTRAAILFDESAARKARVNW